MTKYILPILLVSLLCSSCKKKTVIESELNLIGLKPETFKLIDTTFYYSKKIKSLRFIKTKTEYIDVFFYESGKKKSIGPVKKNQCHNKYVDWYENGKDKWTREYFYGKQIGKSIEYQENGNLKQINDNDKKEITEYWKNGNPKMKFKEGGLQYFYYSNGNFLDKYDPINKTEYLVKFFNENGKIVFSGNSKSNILYKNNDKYNGKIICFFNNGKISHFEEIINGVNDGKFYSYYGNGILKFEGDYKNGKEAFYKCYFENGKVNFIRDAKNKTFTQWNEKGELIK